MKLIDKITIAGVEYTFDTVTNVEKSVCDLCDLHYDQCHYATTDASVYGQETLIAICDLFQIGREGYVYVKKVK